MQISIQDIPEENRTVGYIVSQYAVSKTTAWRLLSGRSAHICPGYHTPKINIADNGWDLVMDPKIMRTIRNMIAYQLKVWQHAPTAQKIEDIAQECYINAYQKSGIWGNMPEKVKFAYIKT